MDRARQCGSSMSHLHLQKVTTLCVWLLLTAWQAELVKVTLSLRKVLRKSHVTESYCFQLGKQSS
jgi:hypothetical protein